MKYLIPILLLLSACDGGPPEGHRVNNEVALAGMAAATLAIASMRKRLIRA